MKKKKLLYFDMEWVPMSASYDDLPEKYKNSWNYRCDKWINTDSEKYRGMSYKQIWDREAVFYPEFIKIVCISFGYFDNDEWKSSTYYGHDEKEILIKAQKLLNKVLGHYNLCGHSIKRFDMPFLAKRMVINKLEVPYLLNNYGKKPWEQTAVDIAEMWGFGSYRETFTPLDWIATSTDIPTSKDDITGENVKHVYYNEDDGLERIKEYCSKDVKVTALVYKSIQKYTNPEA